MSDNKLEQETVQIGDDVIKSEEVTYDIIKEGVAQLENISKSIHVTMKCITDEKDMSNDITSEVKGMNVSMNAIDTDINKMKKDELYAKTGVMDFDKDIDETLKYTEVIQNISDIEDKLGNITNHLYAGIIATNANNPAMEKALSKAVKAQGGE